MVIHVHGQIKKLEATSCLNFFHCKNLVVMKEFFERQRHAQRVQRKATPSQENGRHRGISQDLLHLHTVSSVWDHAKPKGRHLHCRYESLPH